MSRRDFLKLAGLTSLGLIVPPSLQVIGNNIQSSKQNVLIIVFDALSAYNMSLYGYARATTPNLSRLANRATVFHNHYAGSNYTTPGTASILTGTLPWTHRALRLYGTVHEELAGKSIFHSFNDAYRIAFSHNPLANALFEQFIVDISEMISRTKYNLINDGFLESLFSNDEDAFTVAWARSMKPTEGFSYSLFLSQFYKIYRDNKIKNISNLYPYGMPVLNKDNFFTINQGIDGIAKRLSEIQQPFLGYFHFLPPHAPYKPHHDFVNAFKGDGYRPPDKPNGLFTELRPDEVLQKQRERYDEFLLNVDYEFGRLFDYLESSGLLDNTWLVFTSDHGELFERGTWQHFTETLYQPVVRVPLLIFEPRNQTRRDIYSPTSAVDLMPTLLHVTQREIPTWCEGQILPPYAPQINYPIFSIQAKDTPSDKPLSKFSAMLVQDDYKLIYYRGYEQLGAQEELSLLFDLQEDPEELSEISALKKETTAELSHIIKTKLDESNKPYL